MANGYMGRLLNVDLSTSEIREEPLDEMLCRDLIGGYGLGAKFLIDRMEPGTDPLGPSNILGFLTGPLTGTQAITGNRFTVVCKSPLTGTWGDANCGGNFGPHLKFAGYDGLLVTGQSPEPVYLLVDNGRAELQSAANLWGKDTSETEEALESELGDVKVASIGPAGERLSRIAAIINDRGRAAGRSGVGAVMGSKNLKAVAVRGQVPVEVAAPQLVKDLRQYFVQRSAGDFKPLSTYGTLAVLPIHARDGDSPVQNWSGAGGLVDFPQVAGNFDAELVKSTYVDKKYGCWQCPISCGGIASVKHDGPYKGVTSHKPEYETACMFGTNLLNDDFASIIKASDICNRFGIDTISAGATIGWAIECFEKGILTTSDTDGIRLSWGDHQAIIGMLEKMVRREGFGDVLADGAKIAAERVGRGSEQYAMHIGGQELPAHDPRFIPALAVTYSLDATPARHTQGGAFWFPPGYDAPAGFSKYDCAGHGHVHKRMLCLNHVVNAAGLCRFAHDSYHHTFIPNFLSAVTGWEYSLADCELAGERIANLRHAFNLREGLNPLTTAIPDRVVGIPPLSKGPTKGVSVQVGALSKDFLAAMEWDQVTGQPNPRRLKELGLGYLAGG